MRATLSRWCLAVLLSLLPAFASAQYASLTATVGFLKGNAVAIDASGKERTLKVGDKIQEGEKVRLDTQKSKLFLNVSDGTELRLSGKTQLAFAEFNHTPSGLTRKTRLELAFGKVWARVAKLTSKTSRFELKAGGVICGVRGTTIGADYDGKTPTFYNFEGTVYLLGPDGVLLTLPPETHVPFEDGKFGPNGRNGNDDLGTQDDNQGPDEAGAPPPGNDELWIALNEFQNGMTGEAGDTGYEDLNTETRSNALLHFDFSTPEGTYTGGGK